MDDADSGLRNMGFGKWKTRNLNRTEWTSVMKKARPDSKDHSAKEEEEEGEGGGGGRDKGFKILHVKFF
jgi:hypothetical protein